MYRITKSWTFSAAHHLPNLPEGHQCRRVHGHNYRVTLGLESEALNAYGMVVDYGDLGPFAAAIHGRLDHRSLNDVLAVPTAEAMAEWLYEQARAWWPSLVVDVTVQETDGTSAMYRP